ncbi:MAG TPA: hypothetical protein VNQ48_00165 [Microbacteriaceae bacterium]|nr:hypothetical protein [Microbacteriaceae bacterium]
MSEPFAIALVIALLGLGGTGLGILGAQLARLNRRVVKLEHRGRLDWLYIRRLIDHGYKHAPTVPLPEPPEGWLEDTDT